MINFYARNGDEITMEQYAALSNDRDYKVVEETSIGPYWVSTVWLGLDMGGYDLDSPPIIFETMVFFQGQEGPEIERDGMDCYRWSTEEQARRGHEEVCTLVRATVQEDLDA